MRTTTTLKMTTTTTVTTSATTHLTLKLLPLLKSRFRNPQAYCDLFNTSISPSLSLSLSLSLLHTHALTPHNSSNSPHSCFLLCYSPSHTCNCCQTCSLLSFSHYTHTHTHTHKERHTHTHSHLNTPRDTRTLTFPHSTYARF